MSKRIYRGKIGDLRDPDWLAFSLILNRLVSCRVNGKWQFVIESKQNFSSNPHTQEWKSAREIDPMR